MALAAASACDRAAPERASSVTAPSPADGAATCADVGVVRACWSGGSARRVERPLPSLPRPRGGWRCAGTGRERTCVPRARGTGAFACDAAGSCVQRRPRYPDDGEWECADRHGVVICRGGVAAAGVASAPSDPGWLCGQGSSSPWGRRVCVDLSPDVPDEERGYSCRFEGTAGDEQRVCVESKAARVGGPCVARTDCPSGCACAGGACLPPMPVPSCFVDADCGSGECAFGTCTGTAP